MHGGHLLFRALLVGLCVLQARAEQIVGYLVSLADAFETFTEAEVQAVTSSDLYENRGVFPFNEPGFGLMQENAEGNVRAIYLQSISLRLFARTTGAYTERCASYAPAFCFVLFQYELAYYFDTDGDVNTVYLLERTHLKDNLLFCIQLMPFDLLEVGHPDNSLGDYYNVPLVTNPMIYDRPTCTFGQQLKDSAGHMVSLASAAIVGSLFCELQSAPVMASHWHLFAVISAGAAVPLLLA